MDTSSTSGKTSTASLTPAEQPIVDPARVNTPVATMEDELQETRRRITRNLRVLWGVAFGCGIAGLFMLIKFPEPRTFGYNDTANRVLFVAIQQFANLAFGFLGTLAFTTALGWLLEHDNLAVAVSAGATRIANLVSRQLLPYVPFIVSTSQKRNDPAYDQAMAKCLASTTRVWLRAETAAVAVNRLVESAARLERLKTVTVVFPIPWECDSEVAAQIRQSVLTLASLRLKLADDAMIRIHFSGEPASHYAELLDDAMFVRWYPIDRFLGFHSSSDLYAWQHHAFEACRQRAKLSIAIPEASLVNDANLPGSIAELTEDTSLKSWLCEAPGAEPTSEHHNGSSV